MELKNNTIINNFLNDSKLYDHSNINPIIFYKLVNELAKMHLDLLDYINELGYIERDMLLEYETEGTIIYNFLISETVQNEYVLIENENVDMWCILSNGVVRSVIKNMLGVA